MTRISPIRVTSPITTDSHSSSLASERGALRDATGPAHSVAGAAGETPEPTMPLTTPTPNLVHLGATRSVAPSAER